MRRSRSSADCSPRTWVASQAAAHPRPGPAALAHERDHPALGVGGVRAAGGGEGAPDRGRDVVVPGGGQIAGGARAGAGGRLAARDAEGGEADQAGGDRDHGDLAAPARRIGLERGEHRVHGREAIGGIGGQAAQQDLAQPRRHVAAAGGRADPAGGGVGGDLVLAVAAERPLVVERLVEGDRERELIDAGVEGAGAALLGRHVRRRAHDPARVHLRRILAVGDGRDVVERAGRARPVELGRRLAGIE
jgi:hypothetical protein